MTDTPLDQFLLTIDPEGACLKNFTSRIWVFGGPCDDQFESPLSLRDSFWSTALRRASPLPWFEGLDRPENYDEWWAFSGYNDLLEFERDACYLARGVILFSESPGSHAELGALALDDAILSKLLVIVRSEHLDPDNRRSFLNLGPIKRVGSRGSCIIDGVDDIRLSDDDFLLICETVDSWLPAMRSTVAFNPSDSSHKLIIIADLVDLFIVSKQNDLMRLLRFFSVDISDADLKKYLKLLDFFGFIRHEVRGSESFWARNPKADSPWVDYLALGECRFDRSRFKVFCQEFILNDSRRRAILERQS